MNAPREVGIYRLRRLCAKLCIYRTVISGSGPEPYSRPWGAWDYFRQRWPRNAGLRIDFLLLNPAAARRLKAAGVDREMRGVEKASDHAPVWLELA